MNDGEDLLTEVWFQTIEELRTIALYSDDLKSKTQALQILTNYFLGLGQSINKPFMPIERPQISEEEEDPFE